MIVEKNKKINYKVQAFDALKGCESCVHSFIIQRPKVDPGFYVQRTEAEGRFQRYTIQSYAVQAKPAGPWILIKKDTLENKKYGQFGRYISPNRR